MDHRSSRILDLIATDIPMRVLIAEVLVQAGIRDMTQKDLDTMIEEAKADSKSWHSMPSGYSNDFYGASEVIEEYLEIDDRDDHPEYLG